MIGAVGILDALRVVQDDAEQLAACAHVLADSATARADGDLGRVSRLLARCAEHIGEQVEAVREALQRPEVRP